MLTGSERKRKRLKRYGKARKKEKRKRKEKNREKRFARRWKAIRIVTRKVCSHMALRERKYKATNLELEKIII